MQYILEKAKLELIKILSPYIPESDIEIRNPPENIKADFAVPLFSFAKKQKLNPINLTEELLKKVKLEDTIFSQIEAKGGFLNFTFNPVKFSQAVFTNFQELEEKYGSSEEGKAKTIVIDYSSPNIAKPFSVGHLRSTIIGHALCNIFSFMGYTVIGDNHIGDWGTQFGKLMFEFNNSGDKNVIDANPIEELLKLYVKFHEEAKKNPSLEEHGRAWFKKLENGDPEATELWKWFSQISWKEFQRIYDMLDVKFDEVLGESFYNDKLQDIIKEAFDKGLATWGEALPDEVESADDITKQSEQSESKKEIVALIRLDDYGISTPLLIQKSDGASLYATRDLATAKDRINRRRPVEIIYVVGGEQQLYFKQWFKVMELMGYKETKFSHVWFGLVRLPEGRMATREGRVIFLEDVLNEAINRAKICIQDRNLNDREKEEISKIVGIGAVKYADLSQNRIKDIVFDWDKALNMHGDSGPYLQYAYVRMQSILRKSGQDIDFNLVDSSLLTKELEVNLIKAIAQFPEIIKIAAKFYQPNLIASYLFSLAQSFNSFYKVSPVLRAESEELKNTRLYLCKMTGIILRNGLGLLGIQCPEKM